MKQKIKLIEEEFKNISEEFCINCPPDVLALKLKQTLGLMQTLCRELEKG